ncbi:hypothetical protein DSCA_25930 [Desulfosarcina alkanivorans]|uniref:Uncharacterized protein n=1 Tax=Desulfosarcina alkanivorans TaxID=571177 RepID=A0A5K7YJG1_9BACT|nr:hypothetical protein DSCA_25930 [Desulfosarcina alkanivorans]
MNRHRVDIALVNENFAMCNVLLVFPPGNRHHRSREIDAFHDTAVNAPGYPVYQFPGAASDLEDVITVLWRNDVIDEPIQPCVADSFPKGR